MIRFDDTPIAIGFIQIPTDFTLDVEAYGILSQIPNVIWRFQKIAFDSTRITETHFQLGLKRIKDAAAVFEPKQKADSQQYGELSVIALACTSMSFVLGSTIVNAELNKGCTDAIAHNMADAVLHAIHSLGNGRIVQDFFSEKSVNVALLTPYIDEVHLKNKAFFERHNCGIKTDINLDLESDMLVSRVSIESIEEQLDLLNFSEVDVIVIGCSAFAVTKNNIIDKFEKKYNCPVVTSNQAMIWSCLHRTKVKKQDIRKVTGYGTLFQLE